MLDKAIITAYHAHKNQFDKANQYYLFHPLRVMFNVGSDDLKIVAVLHDVVEDSTLSLDDLSSMGFTFEIVEAVDAITRRKNESYMEFIRRCKKNWMARIIKIEDLKDNMDLSRISNPTEEDSKRNKKYAKALNELITITTEIE
jgi:(p)ppGpp synthase/HD superfamily hydrolase